MTHLQPAAVRTDTDLTIGTLSDTTYDTIRDGVGGLIEAAPTDKRGDTTRVSDWVRPRLDELARSIVERGVDSDG